MSELKPCACGGAARIDYMAGDGDYQIVCEACLRATPRLPSLRKLRSDWDRMFMQSLPHGVRHPLEGAWYRLARWVDEALERALGMTWRMHRGAPPGAPLQVLCGGRAPDGLPGRRLPRDVHGVHAQDPVAPGHRPCAPRLGSGTGHWILAAASYRGRRQWRWARSFGCVCAIA